MMALLVGFGAGMMLAAAGIWHIQRQWRNAQRLTDLKLAAELHRWRQKPWHTGH